MPATWLVVSGHDPVHESHQKGKDKLASMPADSTLCFSMFINGTDQIATVFWHPTLNLVGPQRISGL